MTTGICQLSSNSQLIPCSANVSCMSAKFLKKPADQACLVGRVGLANACATLGQIIGHHTFRLSETPAA